MTTLTIPAPSSSPSRTAPLRLTPEPPHQQPLHPDHSNTNHTAARTNTPTTTDNISTANPAHEPIPRRIIPALIADLLTLETPIPAILAAHNLSAARLAHAIRTDPQLRSLAEDLAAIDRFRAEAFTSAIAHPAALRTLHATLSHPNASPETRRRAAAALRAPTHKPRTTRAKTAAPTTTTDNNPQSPAQNNSHTGAQPPAHNTTNNKNNNPHPPAPPAPLPLRATIPREYTPRSLIAAAGAAPPAHNTQTSPIVRLLNAHRAPVPHLS